MRIKDEGQRVLCKPPHVPNNNTGIILSIIPVIILVIMLEHGSKETKSFWKKRSELKFSIAGQGIKGAGTIPNH